MNPVLRFYEILGATFQRDDDLGDSYVTVELGGQKVCFVHVLEGYETKKLTLVYVCEDPIVWSDRMQARDLEAVATQDIGRPLAVEHHVTPHLTIVFEQDETAVL